MQRDVGRITAYAVYFCVEIFADLSSTYLAPGSDTTVINIEKELGCSRREAELSLSHIGEKLEADTLWHVSQPIQLTSK